MEAMILNQDYDTVSVLDAFESFIWTDRYYEAGDCEVYAPATLELIRNLEEGNYLWRKDSEHLMIVNSVILDTSAEDGIHITATGESLEAILKRRIVYPTTINGNLQNGIQKLLNENAINPDNSKRRISNLVFIASTNPRITDLEISELQYSGENLYDSVVELCMAYDLGFKITLNEGTKEIEFRLYIGKDRSYEQDLNPWVVFSQDYDNLTSSNYYSSKKEYKNSAYILGAELPTPGEREGDTTAPNIQNNGVNRYYELEYSDAVGLERREIFIDASSIDDTYEVTISDRTGTDSDGQPIYESRVVDKTMSDSEYIPMLSEEGDLELSETQTTTAFEGVIDATQQYIYGRDFNIGDIVQIANEFEMTSHSRISEIIWCHDLNGETLTPTFINA